MAANSPTLTAPTSAQWRRNEGADLIDVGAESARPSSTRISEAEELRRLVPVLKRLRDKLSIPVCVDTYKAAIAEKASELGVDDLRARLPCVVSNHDGGLILNHMRGTPETWAKLPPLPDVMGSVVSDLQGTVHRAIRVGVGKNLIVVDPGLGFGKRKEQNAEIIARLPQRASLGYPMMVGASRKSFLARATPEETIFANASDVAACILGGAYMVRCMKFAT